jgi:hypothetical protein
MEWSVFDMDPYVNPYVDFRGVALNPGYFTLDNAGNNKTSMGELGLEFGFDWEKRWVRCVGHVVNIVVKQML